MNDKITQSREATVAEHIAESQELMRRQQNQRERQLEEKTKAEAEANAKSYSMLKQRLREVRADVEGAQRELSRRTRSVVDVEEQLADLLRSYTPPETIPAPKPSVKPSIIAKPVVQVEEEPAIYVNREHVPCPVCSVPTPPGIAYHRIEDDPDNMLCIVDVHRCRVAGISQQKIDASLARQKQARV